MFKICKTVFDIEQEKIEKATGGKKSHNYVKRTGVPGNYKYWYKLPNGHIVSSDNSEQAPHVDHSKPFDDDARHQSGSKKSPDKKDSPVKSSEGGDDEDKKKYVAIGFLLGVHDDYENIKSINSLLSKLESDHITGDAALDFLYNEAPDDLKEKIDNVREEYGFDNYETVKNKKKVKKSQDNGEKNMDIFNKSFKLSHTAFEYETKDKNLTVTDNYFESYINGERQRIEKSTKFENVETIVKSEPTTSATDVDLSNLPNDKEQLLVKLHIDSLFNR